MIFLLVVRCTGGFRGVGSSGRGARAAGVIRAMRMARDRVCSEVEVLMLVLATGDENASPNINISVVAGPSTNDSESKTDERINT